MFDCNLTPLNQEAIMDNKYAQYRIDGSQVGKCKMCQANIPVEYQHMEGDLLSCYDCEAQYTLVSRRPVILTALKQRYNDSFIRETRFRG